MEDWKAVRYGIQSETELYNLESDITESNYIAGEHPEIIQKMNRLFEESRTETAGFSYDGVIQNYRARDKYNVENP